MNFGTSRIHRYDMELYEIFSLKGILAYLSLELSTSITSIIM